MSTSLYAIAFALAATVVLVACSKKEPAPESTGEISAAPATETTESAPPEPEPATSATKASELPESSTTAPTAQTANEPAPAAAPAETMAVEPGPAPAPSATETSSAAAPAPASSAKPVDGAQIAKGLCMACHQAGMNGAPRFGNKVAWASRIAQGREKLYQNAINGLRGMPARGGNPNLSDDEVKVAVDYMVKLAGGYTE